MKKLALSITLASMLFAVSASAFADSPIPRDMDRSQLPQKIDFGTDATSSNEMSINSFSYMATGESILIRAIESVSIPLYEYSAMGITDPKKITYVASATTSLFHDGDYISESEKKIALAGQDAVAELIAYSGLGGKWEAFSNHTITDGSSFYVAYTVDEENY